MTAASENPQLPPSPTMLGPGMAGLLSLIVLLSMVFLPLVGPFLALLAPLPLVHQIANGKSSVSAWGWIAAGLVLAVLATHVVWLLAICVAYLLVAVWPAVAVEIWLRRMWSNGRWAALVALLPLFVTSLILLIIFYPTPPADALADIIRKALTQSADIAGWFKLGTLEAEEYFRQLTLIFSYLSPAIVAVYVLCSSLWLRPRLPLLGLPRGKEPFAFFAAEEWLPVAFILGGLGFAFLPEPGKWLAANLLATVIVLYFLHGLAIIHFYLGRRVSGNRVVRLLLAMLALMLPANIILAALGLADNFYSLRRWGTFDEGSDS